MSAKKNEGCELFSNDCKNQDTPQKFFYQFTGHKTEFNFTKHWIKKYIYDRVSLEQR